MAQRIVVPLDGSKNGELALTPAIRLARLYGAHLHLVHAIDGEVVSSVAEVERARELFRAYTEELLARLGGADIEHSCSVLEGNAARVVLDLSSGAALVVLSSHGRSGLRAGLIGSVADKIVRGATAPTLVVPLASRADFEKRPVVIALDGSETAELGLAAGRELAKRLGSPVTLVRAYSIPPPVGAEFVGYPVDVITIMEEAAEAYLAEKALPGEQTVCTMASAVEAIAEAADMVDAGIVVMTSHGKGFAHRIALGSVTDRAMHTLRRALLIVPVGAD
jgi:nucleotide-binding universal stress UspA family protein